MRSPLNTGLTSRKLWLAASSSYHWGAGSYFLCPSHPAERQWHAEWETVRHSVAWHTPSSPPNLDFCPPSLILHSHAIQLLCVGADFKPEMKWVCFPWEPFPSPICPHSPPKPISSPSPRTESLLTTTSFFHLKRWGLNYRRKELGYTLGFIPGSNIVLLLRNYF